MIVVKKFIRVCFYNGATFYVTDRQRENWVHQASLFEVSLYKKIKYF